MGWGWIWDGFGMDFGWILDGFWSGFGRAWKNEAICKGKYLHSGHLFFICGGAALRIGGGGGGGQIKASELPPGMDENEVSECLRHLTAGPLVSAIDCHSFVSGLA